MVGTPDRTGRSGEKNGDIIAKPKHKAIVLRPNKVSAKCHAGIIGLIMGIVKHSGIAGIQDYDQN